MADKPETKAPAGRVQIENLDRSTWRFSVPAVVTPEGLAIDHSKDVTVGDKRNAEAVEQLKETAKSEEDLKRFLEIFPPPVVELTAAQFEELGADNHRYIESLVKQKQLRVTRLAA